MSKRPDRPDVTRQPLEGSEPKKARKDEQSDHVVAMTQLREEIASLQRQLQLKNQQMLGKDKEVLSETRDALHRTFGKNKLIFLPLRTMSDPIFRIVDSDSFSVDSLPTHTQVMGAK